MTTALPYGPFTPQIRRFLQRLATLTPSTEVAIVRDYTSGRIAAPFQAAERRLAMLVSQSGRQAECEAVGRPLMQLVRRSAPTGQGDAPSLTVSAAAEPEPRFEPRDIAEPALAALLALVVRDVLTSADFEALYAPFARDIPVRELD